MPRCTTVCQTMLGLVFGATSAFANTFADGPGNTVSLKGIPGEAFAGPCLAAIAEGVQLPTQPDGKMRFWSEGRLFVIELTPAYLDCQVIDYQARQ